MTPDQHRDFVRLQDQIVLRMRAQTRTAWKVIALFALFAIWGLAVASWCVLHWPDGLYLIGLAFNAWGCYRATDYALQIWREWHQARAELRAMLAQIRHNLRPRRHP